MKLHLIVFLIAAWLALVIPAGGADAPATGSAESAAQIARLIEQLGDKQYEVRERAQEQLIKRGYAVNPSFERAAHAYSRMFSYYQTRAERT